MYLAAETEYRRGLAHRLIDEGVIDFCLADLLPWTERPAYHERIEVVDHRPSLMEEYDIICDLNELPTVGKELMEKMLPYESMAIRLGMRRYNYPTTEYEEEKRKYLQHLRYWNYMLDKYKINLIVTQFVPHSQGKYVVYGLAKVKNIPILLWHGDGTFLERCFWGDSIETIGKSIGERFVNLSKSDISDHQLDDDIVEGYNLAKKIQVVSERKKYDARILGSYSGRLEKGIKIRRNQFMKQYIRSIVRSIVKTKSLSLHKAKEKWFRINHRHLHAYYFYKKHIECRLCQYNKMACEPDYSKNYILYLPQVFPEASIIPLAGAFGEQYNSVQVLAKAAEKEGAYVYVKEHPHSPGRTKIFYDEISNIKNVRLIKTSELSYDLMKHCIAVATQTGTCTWEALCMGKPVLVFGGGYYWKRCPGVFEIVDEEQGADIIRKVMEGIEIDENDLKRYLYAIQSETIKEMSLEEYKKRAFDNTYKMPKFDLTDRVELIKRFIKEKSIS